MSDPVNHPAHYTAGKAEAIDVMEDAIRDAPDPIAAAAHYTALKYLLRLWHKEDPRQDAQKAAWYLNRLIERLPQ